MPPALEKSLASPSSRLVERILTLSESYPRLRFMRDGKRTEASVEIARGQITDIRGQDENAPVAVPTDAGVIVEPNREVGTDKMVGCATLIISHPKGKLFAHLTPTHRLAYMSWDQNKDECNETTIASIIASLKEAGLPLEECSGAIIGNVGTASGKFKHERLLTIWRDMGDRLSKVGLASWNIIAAPLDETIVFSTPDKASKVLVMGRPAHVNEEGWFEVDKRNTEERWIELTG
ncbi:MAG: hypothetical protein Q7R83_03260 [bacterium]|nr:hypothetical protein [bacterium]